MNLSALRKRIISKSSAYLLSRNAKAVRRDSLTYLSPMKLRRLESTLNEVIKRHVPGDIVEFGVALGGSGILMAKKANHNRRFFGLDVFAMIPEPKSAKDDQVSKDRYRMIAEGKSKGIGDDLYYGYRDNLLDYVSQKFREYDVSVDNVRINLVKGLFEDTWSTLDISEIAFAHVDCDWYDPVVFALEAVSEKLSLHGKIIIDDYYDYLGCRTAVDEFMAKNARFRMIDGVNPILYRYQ